jgi:outer membrane protein OmpA-like peptidoglycan-associated protein
MSDEFNFETASARTGEATLEQLLDRLEAQGEGGELPGEGTGYEVYPEGNPTLEQERGRFRPSIQRGVRRRPPAIAVRGRRLGWGLPARRFNRYSVPYWPDESQRTLWAQACLAQLVGPWVPQTGVVDEGTRQAITTFQTPEQLPVTGLLDNETVAALEQACSEANDRGAFEQEWENPPGQPQTRTEPVLEGPRIFFKRDSIEIRQDASTDSMVHFVDALQQIQSFLKRRGASGHVTLHGFASAEGNPSHNLGLSRRRAERIRHAMVELGIPENQISAVGDGSRNANGPEFNRAVAIEFR